MIATQFKRTYPYTAGWQEEQQVPVVLVGMGAIGQAVAVAARNRAGLEIRSAVDVDPNKVGRDLGELVSQPKWSVEVAKHYQRQVGAAVAIHTTGSFLEDVTDQLIALLDQGLNVVSSTEELAFPWLKHPEHAKRIDQAARRNNVAIVGVGVNPGFVMEMLPLVLSQVSQSVTAARVSRVVDTSRRRFNLQVKTGAGMTTDEFSAALEAGRMGHIGLAESTALLALGLGWHIDRVEEEISPVVANRRLASAELEVPAGKVAGLHQVAKAFADGRSVVELDLTMALGSVQDRDEITLEGTPDLHLAIPAGVTGDLATVAALLNSVPAILKAGPGLKTVLDLRLPRLSR